MRERLRHYLSPPVFPADEDKTFTASLLHVILWSLLVGICLYTLIAPIQPHMRLIAWLYVLALGGLALGLMLVMRRGYVQPAAISVNIGLWIIITVAAYFNGGVAAPAYSGYLIIIVCTSLLVSWRWGLVMAAASALTGAFFVLAANNNSLPEWQSTYSYGSVWSANVAYFCVATMLLALALRAIKHASQQTRHETAARLKTEQALSHSEQRFHAIFDSVNDAIFVQDISDGRILDVNQTMCEMYGYTAEEARHLLVGDLSADYPPYTQTDALAWMHKAARGEPQVYEWHAKTHDGRLFWVEVNMRLAPIDERDRLLVVVRDIDDRKRAEDALRREQAYYEAIVNATPVMLWLKDAENRILRFNPAAARIEGVNAAEVEGKSAYDLYPREQAEAYYRDDLEVIRSGRPRLGIVEQYMTMGNGRLIWVEMGKVPVRNEQGNIVGVLACAIDITERKAAEERERRVGQGLRTVIEAAQELINCADLNSLYQRSVELAREKLGLERCGLYLLDEREEFIQGTFGTDHQGRTTDERGARHPVEDHPEVFSMADRMWFSYEDSYTYWKDDHDHNLPGRGWNVATPIHSHRRTIGVLYNDTGISHAPLDETQQDVVAVYCSLLGGLLELKRTEAELAHERDLLRSLMDNFPDTIYFKDTASRFTRINQAQARMLGLAAPEEAIGRTDADFFQNSDLHQMFLAEEQHLMISGEPIIDRVEYNPTPDGQPRWLSASKVPLRDASGQIVGLVGISRDITDRRRMEETLRESQARFGSAFEHAAVGMALVAPDHHIVQTNRAFCQMVGYSAAELTGQFFSNLTHPDDVAISVERHRQLFDGEIETYQFEKRYLRKDGQVVWVLLNVSAVRDAANRPQYAIAQVQDITERKRVELALRESESTMRALLDAIPDAIFRFDAQGVFKDYIPAKSFATLFSPSDFIGQPYQQVLPAEMAQLLSDNLQFVLETGEPRLYEYALPMDGQTHYYESRLVKMAQGDVLGIVRDVTARRQAEAAIRESEALFRSLADDAPAFIALSDETGLATYLNRAWQEFRDHAPALPIDEWAERIHPEDRRRYLHEFRSAMQGQRKFTTEYRLRRADGQYRWLLDTVVPRYSAHEQFAGFIGIAVDITDRKNAEEALRRSESRLRLLTDNMVDSISQVDAQQRLVYASPSAERVFGYALRELLGRLLYDYVHPEDAVRLRHNVLTAAELHAPSLRSEYRYRHAAGHYLWVESEMRLLYDDRGSLAGAVFGSRDISIRKQVEAEREDLIEELADKNAELERFTYTVSHDLKSPLITIRGFLGFLEKDALSGSFDRLRDDITRITEATTRMQRLLDELLELSRIGRMNNLPEVVPFAQIAREALELVQGRIMARGVQVEMANDLPAVYGDRLRLVEVLQNLIDNAVKFMGDQAEPRIIIGALDNRQSGSPVFFVQDNGVGIEPEYFERIFGLFNKLDAKSEGTGVGLALVKRIIEVHGGRIWVESEGAGRGTAFCFTLGGQDA